MRDTFRPKSISTRWVQSLDQGLGPTVTQSLCIISGVYVRGIVIITMYYLLSAIPLCGAVWNTHQTGFSPQGNGNEIQMVTIHEITRKLLRVCKRGLQWDQPWKAQRKEVFDRTGRGGSCLALEEWDPFPGTGSIVKVSDKTIKNKSGRWKREHQDDWAIRKEHGGEEKNEDKWASPELCICGWGLVPCAVRPGANWRNTPCLVKGGGCIWLPRPG